MIAPLLAALATAAEPTPFRGRTLDESRWVRADLQARSADAPVDVVLDRQLRALSSGWVAEIPGVARVTWESDPIGALADADPGVCTVAVAARFARISTTPSGGCADDEERASPVPPPPVVAVPARAWSGSTLEGNVGATFGWPTLIDVAAGLRFGAVDLELGLFPPIPPLIWLWLSGRASLGLAFPVGTTDGGDTRVDLILGGGPFLAGAPLVHTLDPTAFPGGPGWEVTVALDLTQPTTSDRFGARVTGGVALWGRDRAVFVARASVLTWGWVRARRAAR